jgi:putative copper export protein
VLWLDAVAHFLHLAGAIVWIGGMAFLAFAAGPVLRRELPPADRLRVYNLVGRRFRAMEGLALLALLGSGVYKLASVWSTLNWADAFGRIRVVKLHLVAVALVLTVLHGFVWGPRLVDLRDRPDSPAFRRATRLVVLGAQLEFLTAAAVVFCGALLRVNPF